MTIVSRVGTNVILDSIVYNFDLITAAREVASSFHALHLHGVFLLIGKSGGL